MIKCHSQVSTEAYPIYAQTRHIPTACKASTKIMSEKKQSIEESNMISEHRIYKRY